MFFFHIDSTPAFHTPFPWREQPGASGAAAWRSHSAKNVHPSSSTAWVSGECDIITLTGIKRGPAVEGPSGKAEWWIESAQRPFQSPEGTPEVTMEKGDCCVGHWSCSNQGSVIDHCSPGVLNSSYMRCEWIFQNEPVITTQMAQFLAIQMKCLRGELEPFVQTVPSWNCILIRGPQDTPTGTSLRALQSIWSGGLGSILKWEIRIAIHITLSQVQEPCLGDTISLVNHRH